MRSIAIVAVTSLLVVLMVANAAAVWEQAPEGWVDDKPEVGAIELRDIAERDGCPNSCSGHGRCLSDNTCQCQTGWVGDDCSYSDQLITWNTPISAEVEPKTFKYFHITLSGSNKQVVWIVNQSSSTADCDLYLRRNAYPTRYSYDLRDITTDVNFQIALPDPVQAGTWYAGVYGYTECDFTINIIQQSPCPNACSGHGVCTESIGQCTCVTGFTGVDCSQSLAVLSNGVPAHNTVASGQINYYQFDVIATSNKLVFTVNQSSSSDDCDIFVKFGSLPSQFNFDYRDDSLAQNFAISIDSPHSGSWYVAITGFSRSTPYTLTATSSVACPNSCSGAYHGICQAGACACRAGYSGTACEKQTTWMASGTNYHGYVDQNSWNYFRVKAQSADNLVVSLSQTSAQGDCDLYIKEGDQPPTRWVFDYRDVSLRSNVSITIENPLNKTWQIGVFGYSECNFTIAATLTTNCPNSCSGHGTCNSGVCSCANGYSGEDCSSSMVALANGEYRTDNLYNGQWDYFKIDNVHSGLTVFVTEASSMGAVWLFVSSRDSPTLLDHDFSATNTNSPYHSISIARPAGNSPTSYIAGVYANPLAPTNQTLAYTITVFSPPF